MNNLERLKHLFDHWTEHNKEHAKTYLEWAKKLRHSEIRNWFKR